MGKSGGGGGSSGGGKVRYPRYIEIDHARFLANGLLNGTQTSEGSAAFTLDNEKTSVEALMRGLMVAGSTLNKNYSADKATRGGLNPYEQFSLNTSLGVPSVDNQLILPSLETELSDNSITTDEFGASTTRASALSRIDAGWEAIENRDAVTDWGVLVDAADTKSDTLFDDAEINTNASEFGIARRTELLRDINLFAGGMADVNATSSSAFVIGVTNLIESHNKVNDKYRSDLKQRAYDLKKEFVAKSVGTLTSEDQFNMTSRQAAATDFAELVRVKYLAAREFIDKKIEHLTNEYLWDINLYQYAGNLMAAPTGGTIVPKEHQIRGGSSVAGPLAGAFAGAGAAMTAGAGGLGTLGAGLLGGGVGAF